MLFLEDLLAVLRRWRAKGDRVVLIMDANKNVLHGEMCKQLTQEDLQMREVVQSATVGSGPKTWFRGSESIDGIWVSLEIDVISASYLPFNGSLGDHRPVMADLTMSLMLGKHLKNIAPVQARWLNSKVTRTREAYIKQLEALYQEHGIWDKLEGLAKSADFPVTEEAAQALENLDQLTEKTNARGRKKMPQTRSGPLRIQPTSQGMAGQMSCDHGPPVA